MRIRTLAIGAVLGIGSLALAAQAGSAGNGQQPVAGTIAMPSQALDSELSLIEREMMSAVKAMPAEKFSFAPSAAIFVPAQTTEYEGVRTFAQQATHVAQANYSLYSIVSGLKPDVDVRALGKLTSKDDVVAALAGSFRFGHKAIATLTPANAFEVVKTQGARPADAGNPCGFWHCPCERPLRADRRIPQNEWNCPTSQRKALSSGKSLLYPLGMRSIQGAKMLAMFRGRQE